MIEITVPEWVVWWLATWIGLRILHELFDLTLFFLGLRDEKQTDTENASAETGRRSAETGRRPPLVREKP